MKLIYFSNSDLFSRKANAIQVMKMCEAFSHKFEGVTLYAYSNKKNISGVHDFYGVKNNFSIIVYPLKKNRLTRVLNSLFTLLYNLKKKNKDTVIYSREIFSAFFSSIIGFKNIYELHNIPVPRSSFLVNYIIKAKTNLFFITISNSLKNKIKELYQSKSPIYAFHDGATLTSNSFSSPPNFYDRSSFNIGYVGHLYQGRGIELIIDLAKQLPQFSFQIIGGEKKDIEKLKKHSTNNIFYHGFVSPSDTPKYRYFSDILLMPYMKGLGNEGSLADTSSWMSPMKLFEYMSSAKPIISTDLPVLREVLNNENSILVPYEVQSWKDAILKIYNDKSFGAYIGQNAYNDLVSNYTWESRAEGITNLIKKTLNT